MKAATVSSERTFFITEQDASVKAWIACSLEFTQCTLLRGDFASVCITSQRRFCFGCSAILLLHQKHFDIEHFIICLPVQFPLTTLAIHGFKSRHPPLLNNLSRIIESTRSQTPICWKINWTIADDISTSCIV